jgi:hypothetical protein
MAIVFMMNEEIARGMVCFFHQKKHSYLILIYFLFQKTILLFVINLAVAESGNNTWVYWSIL